MTSLRCVFLIGFLYLPIVGYTQNIEIALPDTLHSNYNRAVVNGNSHVLIWEYSFNDVYSIDISNGNVQKIDARESFPGFNWAPISFQFIDETNIFFTNSAPWGATITKENEVVDVLGKKFKAPLEWYYNKKGQIGGIIYDGVSHYFRVSNKIGETIYEVPIFQNSVNKEAIARFVGGGVIFVNDYWIFANAIENTLYQLKEGEEIPRSISVDSERAKWLKTKISYDPSNIFGFVGGLKGISSINRIHKISESTFVVAILHQSDSIYEYQKYTVDKNGNIELLDSLQSPIDILAIMGDQWIFYDADENVIRSKNLFQE